MIYFCVDISSASMSNAEAVNNVSLHLLTAILDDQYGYVTSILTIYGVTTLAFLLVHRHLNLSL